jgi:hypothetical protein
VGGENYQFKTREIMELMDYFIVLSWDSIGEELTEDNVENLKDYLEENINQFKHFLRLESFVSEFPTIQLETDMNDNFIVMKSQYSQLQDKLYDVIRNIYDLNNCIINYDSVENRLEIIDASFETIFTLKSINLIDCKITNGEYIRCDFQRVEIKNAHLSNCVLVSTELFNCKLENCEVDESSLLRECYFEGGTESVMNGDFQSGIMRGGVVGKYGTLGSGVEIVTADSSYFGAFDTDEEKGDIKKGIKKLTFKGKI